MIIGPRKSSMSKTHKSARMLVYFRNQGQSSRFFLKQHQETYKDHNLDQDTDPMLGRGKDRTMCLVGMGPMEVDREGLGDPGRGQSVASRRHFQREVIRVQSDLNTQGNLKFQGIQFPFLT